MIRAASLAMSELARILKQYKDVRVLVTGVTGFIGRWVARLISAAAADLWLVTRDAAKLNQIFRPYGVKGQIVMADLYNREDVVRVVEQVRPAIIFNLAGYGVDPGERDESAAFLMNDGLVGDLAEAIMRVDPGGWLGQRLVHTGSAMEYGSVDGVVTEESPPHPINLYGKSKLAGTRRLLDFCATHGLPGMVARLFTVYGPGEHPHRLLPSLLRVAREKKPLQLTSGQQERDFTYVAEVAEGLLRLGLVRHAKGGLVNLASGRLHAIREFALVAASTLGFSPDLLQFGVLPTRQDELWQGPVAIQRLVELLDWRPTMAISAGIRATQEFIAAVTC